MTEEKRTETTETTERVGRPGIQTTEQALDAMKRQSEPTLERKVEKTTTEKSNG